jgi:hypothetical protein
MDKAIKKLFTFVDGGTSCINLFFDCKLDGVPFSFIVPLFHCCVFQNNSSAQVDNRTHCRLQKIGSGFI